MTASCICSLFEKQIVFRCNRFRWVRKLRLWRSILCVHKLPIQCCASGATSEKTPNHRCSSAGLGRISIDPAIAGNSHRFAVRNLDSERVVSAWQSCHSFCSSAKNISDKFFLRLAQPKINLSEPQNIHSKISTASFLNHEQCMVWFRHNTLSTAPNIRTNDCIFCIKQAHSSS